jgi:hypothetical protein
MSPAFVSPTDTDTVLPASATMESGWTAKVRPPAEVVTGTNVAATTPLVVQSTSYVYTEPPPYWNALI